jgi:hypothetical protein
MRRGGSRENSSRRFSPPNAPSINFAQYDQPAGELKITFDQACFADDLAEGQFQIVNPDGSVAAESNEFPFAADVTVTLTMAILGTVEPGAFVRYRNVPAGQVVSDSTGQTLAPQDYSPLVIA